MASVNKAILLGNLGRDPEVRYTQNGTAVANFSIATTERWSKNGEKHEHTEWHSIVAWGRLGEICGEYLKKGSPVYIEGRIRTREWTDTDGAKRRSKEIVANAMQMLGSRNKGGDPGPKSTQATEEDPAPKSEQVMEDDIPF